MNNNEDISQDELAKALDALPADQRADIEAKIKELEEQIKNGSIPEEALQKPMTFSEKLYNDMKDRHRHENTMRKPK